MPNQPRAIIPVERIEKKIYFIRGENVMIDRDLAALYGVTTAVLNQAVRRNKLRFPDDFMFRLSKEEMKNWVSQIVIPNSEKKGIRITPLVFTEQGVAMLSSVLRSKRAIAVNIQIIRTFTKLREMIADSDALRRKLERLEAKYDANFKQVFDAIKSLIIQKDEPREEIGFKVSKD